MMIKNNRIVLSQKVDKKTKEDFALAVSDLISEHSESGVMIFKSPEEIVKNFNNFRIIIDTSQRIHGVFELRPLGQKYLEIGSVLSLTPGVGSLLLLTFETIRKSLEIEYGFAVTKNRETAEKFFVKQTKGIRGDFPSDFERAQEDRYCVVWK